MKIRANLLLCILMQNTAFPAATQDALCELRMSGVSPGSIASAYSRNWQDAFTRAKGDLRRATSSAPWNLTGIESPNRVEIIDAESLVGKIVAGVMNRESRAESVVHTFLGQVLGVENLAKPGDRPFYSATILESDGQTRQILISLASPLRVRLVASQNPAAASSAAWIDGVPSGLSGIMNDISAANRPDFERELFRAQQRLSASTRDPNLWREAGLDLPHGTLIEDPASLVGRFIAGVTMTSTGRHDMAVSTFGGRVISILDLTRPGGPKFFSASLDTSTGIKSVLISLAKPLRVYIGP
jgi:hypothetical protein